MARAISVQFGNKLDACNFVHNAAAHDFAFKRGENCHALRVRGGRTLIDHVRGPVCGLVWQATWPLLVEAGFFEREGARLGTSFGQRRGV